MVGICCVRTSFGYRFFKYPVFSPSFLCLGNLIMCALLDMVEPHRVLKSFPFLHIPVILQPGDACGSVIKLISQPLNPSKIFLTSLEYLKFRSSI